MKIPALFLLAFAAGIPAQAAVELQYERGARPAAFGKVHIAPPTVEFDRNFVSDHTSWRSEARLTPEQTRRLAADMGESLRRALAEALRARGFEIAAAPGADVLRIAPALRDLYVNAPEGSTARAVRHYVREAGKARMEVEGVDPSGARVFRASEERAAGRIEEISRATDVSNRFWFDAMFRRWAEDFAVALAAAR